VRASSSDYCLLPHNATQESNNSVNVRLIVGLQFGEVLSFTTVISDECDLVANVHHTV